MDMVPELRRKVHERVFDSITNYHANQMNSTGGSGESGESGERANSRNMGGQNSAFTAPVVLHSTTSTSTSSSTTTTKSLPATATATASTTIETVGEWCPKVHDATELLTLDLVELIETNRTNDVAILELEGTLRELGVGEFEPII